MTDKWYGHKFREIQKGKWRCECGQEINEALTAPDVSGLVEIAQEIVDLHAKRKVVLTVHVEALEDALATYHKQQETPND